MGHDDATLSIEGVVAEGLCVGCGACAATTDSPFTMKSTSQGTYLPERSRPTSDAGEAAAAFACPFSGVGPNEDALAADRFGDLPHDAALGHYRRLRAGHVATGEFRAAGTSGGMTSWFLSELFERDCIDAVIHVRPRAEDEDGQPLFRYDVSSSAATSSSWVKSRYHAVEMSEAIALLRQQRGRYAFVGVPCFVKAIRLLAKGDPELRDRLVATIALVCGHLKSARYAEFAAWQMGIAPADLSTFDFRTKVEGRPANLYAMTATGTNALRQRVQITRGAEDIRGSDWGIGLFKLSACDYCDDVVGETADLSMGDAWIAPYAAESKGTNLVITRSALAESIIAGGEARGEVLAVDLSVDDARATQTSGLRHRREGLAIRLAARGQRGAFVPTKRVAPDPEGLHSPAGQRYLARERVAQVSHEHYETARRSGDLDIFFREMEEPLRAYYGSSTAQLSAWAIVHLERLLPNRLLTLISKLHTERLDRRRRSVS